VKRSALLKKAGKTAMVCIGVAVVCASAAIAQRPTKPSQAVQSMVLDSLDGLEIKAVSEKGAEAVKVKANIAEYKGRRALHMLNDDTTMVPARPPAANRLPLSKALTSKTEASNLVWSGCRDKDRIARAGALWGSLFAFKVAAKSSKISICALPTDEQTTNSAATTPCSTVPFQIFHGPAFGRRTQEFTNPTWTLRKRRGRGSRLWFRERKRNFM